MMPLRVAICDDEALMLQQLTEQVGGFLQRQGVAADLRPFAAAGALLQALPFWQPEVVLLDIKMPPPDGLAAARLLRQQGFSGFLIFVTVLREQVFQAFEVQPFDYLLKPLQPAGLAKTMHRLLEAKASREQAEEPLLLVSKVGSSRLVPLPQLMYCEVLGRKVYLHLQDEVIDYYERLEQLAGRLDERFFRCHRSYLVNLDYVRGCSGGMLRLAQGQELPVSRLREQGLRQALLQRLQKRGGNGLV